MNRIALLPLAYCFLRLSDFTISSNIVDCSAIDLAIGFAGVFCGVAGGLMLMKDGSSIVVKCLGVWLAVLRQSWMAAFYLGFVTLLNLRFRHWLPATTVHSWP